MSTLGNRTILLWSLTGNAGTWTKFSAIEDIDGQETDVPDVAVTKLGDVAEKYDPGQTIEYGAIKVKLASTSSLKSQVDTWVDAGTKFYVTAQTGDATTWTDYVGTSGITLSTGYGSHRKYYVFVSKFHELGTVNRNKEILSMLTLKIADKPTFTAGA